MANKRFQEYDLPAAMVELEEIVVGDVRVMPDQSRWVVESMSGHMTRKGWMYRLRVIPDTPDNRKKVWNSERDM